MCWNCPPRQARLSSGIAMMGDDQQGAPAVAIRPLDEVRAGECDGANLARVQPGDKDIERLLGEATKMQVRIAAGWRLPPAQGKNPLQIGKRIGAPRPINHPEITGDQSDKRHGRAPAKKPDADLHEPHAEAGTALTQIGPMRRALGE